MVHALEQTHGLLKKGGLLIDIHPSGKPPPIEVHVDGEVLLAGYLEEKGGFVEYLEADAALVSVTRRGLFELEREGMFPFKTHASSVVALTDYFEAQWSDAVLPEDVMGRLVALMAKSGRAKEVVVREDVRIARYRSRDR